MEEGIISQGHTPDGREDCGWRGCSGVSDTCQCACRRESLECHTDSSYPSVAVVQPSC